jgi:hypothetical protein
MAESPPKRLWISLIQSLIGSSHRFMGPCAVNRLQSSDSWFLTIDTSQTARESPEIFFHGPCATIWKKTVSQRTS